MARNWPGLNRQEEVRNSGGLGETRSIVRVLIFATSLPATTLTNQIVEETRVGGHTWN